MKNYETVLAAALALTDAVRYEHKEDYKRPQSFQYGKFTQG